MTLRKHQSAFTSGHPLHRSVRALLMHTAPTSGDNAHSFERIRMMEFYMRKPPLNMTFHPHPCHGIAVATSSESAPPASCDLETKARHRLPVAGNPVVTVVPFNHRTQPLTLFRDGLVHSIAQFDFKLVKFCLRLLPNRSPRR